MRLVTIMLALLPGCELMFEVDPAPEPRPRDCAVTAPDEDGDGHKDDCDLCPASADAALDAVDAGEDLDGDGVGDRCDPDPLQPAGQRWFAGMTTGRDWIENPLWTFDGTAMPLAAARGLLSTRSHVRAHVETRFFFASVPEVGQTIAGAWLRASPSSRGVPDGYSCGVLRDSAGESYLAAIRSSEGPPGDLILAQSAERLRVTAGASHVVHAEIVENQTLLCTSYGDDGVLEAAIETEDPTFTAGHVGIHVENITAYFDYAFVVAD